MYGIGYGKILEGQYADARSYTAFFVCLFVLIMTKYYLMLSTTLFDKYFKCDYGYSINFEVKTKVEKILFVLGFNSTGVIRNFLFDLFCSVIKPLLLELPAYLLQVISCGKIMALEKMEKWIKVYFIEGLFGFDL